MTKVEYENALAAAKIAYDSECKKIKVRYARENNPVKVGDIINNGIFIIKVEEITWSPSGIMGMLPQCIYYGIRLKADGKTPYKNNERLSMSQHLLKTINGKPISDYADQTRE